MPYLSHNECFPVPVSNLRDLGWIIGDFSVEDRMCRDAVRHHDFVAVSVHYRL